MAAPRYPEMTVSHRLEALADALPRAYRARPFRDEDREPLVAERNASLPEVEHQSASEWRYWEQSAPDDTRVRAVVDGADGAIAASCEVGNGGPFRVLLEHPGSAADLDIVAFDGQHVVAMTTSYRGEGGKRGGTGFTGTLRAYRGRGIAFTLKAEALARAKASGIRWMLTTNDEPNKAMRGINYTLGYESLSATIQLEKKL